MEDNLLLPKQIEDDLKILRRNTTDTSGPLFFKGDQDWVYRDLKQRWVRMEN